MTMKLDISTTETYQKLFTKLDNPDVTYQNFVKRLAKYHLQVKAIIQVKYILLFKSFPHNSHHYNLEKGVFLN